MTKKAGVKVVWRACSREYMPVATGNPCGLSCGGLQGRGSEITTTLGNPDMTQESSRNYANPEIESAAEFCSETPRFVN
eukprot:1710744-Amphidinium_carterae.1